MRTNKENNSVLQNNQVNAMTKTIELDGIKYELVPIKEEKEETNIFYPDRPEFNQKFWYVTSSAYGSTFEDEDSDWWYIKSGNCFFGDNAEKQAKAYKMLIDKVWVLREKYGEIKDGDPYWKLCETLNEWDIGEIEYEWQPKIYSKMFVIENIHERIGLALHIDSCVEERKKVLALLLAVYNKDFSRVDELKLLD